MLTGGFLLLTAAVGLVFDVLVAAAGLSVMNRTDVRLHAAGTGVLLVGVVWTFAAGPRGGRGPLGQAGRLLLVLAAVMWVLFAVGPVFVLAQRG